MPLAEGNVTIKLVGGTYSTWAAFWDDLDDSLSDDITCTVDASGFTEGSAPGAVTAVLGGYTLHVLPASFPTKTDASDGARFTLNYVDIVLNMQMEGSGTLIIEGMVFIEGTSEPGALFYFTGIETEFNFTCRRNIIKGTDYAFYGGDATLDAGMKIYNNIFYDCDSQGIYIINSISSALIANNTVVHCGINNFYCFDKAFTLKNNLSYDSVGACFIHIASANGYNNADSDDTGEDGDWADGSGNVPGIGDPFNNLAADDFTITTEGDIGSAGLDLSGDFTDDFFGTERSNWTIGACEYGVAAPEDLNVSVSECVDTEESLV